MDAEVRANGFEAFVGTDDRMYRWSRDSAGGRMLRVVERYSFSVCVDRLQQTRLGIR